MTTPHGMPRAVLVFAVGLATAGCAFLAAPAPAWATRTHHPQPYAAAARQSGRAWNFTVVPLYSDHTGETVTAKVTGYPRSWHSVHWSVYTKSGHRVVGGGQVPLTRGSGSQTLYSVPDKGRFVAAYTRPSLTKGRTYFVTNCDNTC